MRSSSNPAFVVASIAAVTLALSVYGAPEIRDEIDKHEWLRESLLHKDPPRESLLREWVSSVVEAQDSLGIGALRATSARLRQRINERYIVLELPEEPDIVAPPPEQPPPDVNGTNSELKHWTAPRPRRVLVAGASSIQFAVGVELERRMPTYQGVKVKRFGQLATGLVRADFFDWPKKMRELVVDFKPDLVIANFGGNDAQSIPTGKYDKVAYNSDAWDDAYKQLVFGITDIAAERDAGVVFFGMPVMRSAKFTKKMKRVNRLQQEALDEAGGHFVSTWDMSGTKGVYKKSIRYGGKRGLMRTSDGVHYSKLGARFVVEQALQQVERHFAFTPKDTKLARTEPHFLIPEAGSSTVSFVAYVPQQAIVGQDSLPMLLVLREAQADWAEWPGHPHRQAQTLAQKHQAVIVLLGPETAELNSEELQSLLSEEFILALPRWLPVSNKVVVLGRGSRAAVAQALASSDAVEVAAAANGILAAQLAAALQSISATGESPP